MVTAEFFLLWSLHKVTADFFTLLLHMVTADFLAGDY